MNKFIILNSNHQVVKYCKSYYEADTFCKFKGYPDWSIISYLKFYPSRATTVRQRCAVKFVESVLNVEFTGNLYDYKDVSPFLEDYLEIAKQQHSELKCEFKTDRGY